MRGEPQEGAPGFNRSYSSNVRIGSGIPGAWGGKGWKEYVHGYILCKVFLSGSKRQKQGLCFNGDVRAFRMRVSRTEGSAYWLHGLPAQPFPTQPHREIAPGPKTHSQVFPTLSLFQWIKSERPDTEPKAPALHPLARPPSPLRPRQHIRGTSTVSVIASLHLCTCTPCICPAALTPLRAPPGPSPPRACLDFPVCSGCSLLCPTAPSRCESLQGYKRSLTWVPTRCSPG